MHGDHRLTPLNLAQTGSPFTSLTPEVSPHKDLRHLALLQMCWTRLPTGPARQASLFFRTTGCVYSIKGECTMCGFINGTLGGGIMSADDLIRQFEVARRAIDNEVPVVALYNSGSFFDDRQFPSVARTFVLQSLAQLPSVRKIIVESRPELVKPELVNEARHNLGDKAFEVGIGLESSSDTVRMKCLSKKFTLTQFEDALRLLKLHSVLAFAYVFLKAPYLTEKEALEDAVKTIEYSFDQGVDRVMLEPAFVQADTRLASMHAAGQYKTPWLWTVLEVVRRTSHLGQIGVGYPDDVPPPLYTAGNCRRCTSAFWSYFDQFNKTGDITASGDLNCGCEQVWRASLTDAEIRLIDRIDCLKTTDGGV